MACIAKKVEPVPLKFEVYGGAAITTKCSAGSYPRSHNSSMSRESIHTIPARLRYVINAEDHTAAVVDPRRLSDAPQRYGITTPTDHSTEIFCLLMVVVANTMVMIVASLQQPTSRPRLRLFILEALFPNRNASYEASNSIGMVGMGKEKARARTLAVQSIGPIIGQPLTEGSVRRLASLVSGYFLHSKTSTVNSKEQAPDRMSNPNSR